MLFRCNYLGLVGGGHKPFLAPNKLLVWDDLKKVPAISLEFNGPIKGVRLRRDRIVVVLGEFLMRKFRENWFKTCCIFQRELSKFTHSHKRLSSCSFSRPAKIRMGCASSVPTPTNRCSLSQRGDPATSSSSISQTPRRHRSKSAPMIQRSNALLSICKVCCVFAFPPTVRELKVLLSTGTRLATASERGTLVRIFDTTTGQKVAELRRGSNQAKIYCINFNQTSTAVVVASDHGTIHVFNLEEEEKREKNISQILPKYFSSNWSFCKFSIPAGPSIHCICAFGADSNSIIVISADGNYYKFIFNNKGEISREVCSQFLDEVGTDT